MNKEEMHSNICQVLADPVIFKNMVQSMFNEIDKDKNGALEIDELKAYMSTLFSDSKANTQALASLFEELDADESNTIDVDEFGKFIRAFFEQQKKMLEVALSAPK
jgi:Ca2+-binding EF-hand superfamily protein